eukprot:TRINITY_DN13232_c0_g1_i3.p1 TRINITY_DN13232_c0_g1~~TRINITY_DN13232_c0_g1_i3.p1  ORF type:complete len:411 (-),score=63.43 TRINITY_DN13232_c0_g1_i3:82-1314(-)
MFEGLWNILKSGQGQLKKTIAGSQQNAHGQQFPPLTAMQEQDFTLVMCGDVMLGRLVNDSFKTYPQQIQNVWGDTLPILKGEKAGGGGQDREAGVKISPQIVIGNLECAVTDNEEKFPKTFNYKLSPGNLQALKVANFEYVSLANNHSLDYCEAGLIETVKVLQEAGIQFSGAGKNLAEAAKPAFVKVADQKMAVFSYSDHYDYWAASPQKAGINYINPGKFDVDNIRSSFAAARQQQGADLIGVFIHWGPNWRWEPSKEIVGLGHTFVDQGADFIFGHSSHHIQGIEIYKGHPIVYGAGGFVDDYAVDDGFRNDLSFIYKLGFKNNRPHCMHLIPTYIKHTWMARGSQPPYLSNVQLAKGSDQKWLLTKMTDLCSRFGTEVVRDSREGGLFIQMMDKEVENIKGDENVQ